jgi:hypothetical protein
MGMDIANCRILALAIRARWLGYAVVEGRCKLVDWGMTFFQPNDRTEIRATKRRIDFLLSSFNPTLIAIAASEVAASNNASTVRALVRSIRTKARARSMRFQSVNRKYIRDSFLEHNARSKHEIALALVNRFPELLSKLPQKRKTWEKENFRMTLFDAVASGVACWSRLSEAESSRSNNG